MIVPVLVGRWPGLFNPSFYPSLVRMPMALGNCKIGDDALCVVPLSPRL
jgi:hypothetical protein